MKYRIVERPELRKTWFIVEKKYWCSWFPVRNYLWSNLEEAKKEVERLESGYYNEKIHHV